MTRLRMKGVDVFKAFFEKISKKEPYTIETLDIDRSDVSRIDADCLIVETEFLGLKLTAFVWLE